MPYDSLVRYIAPHLFLHMRRKRGEASSPDYAIVGFIPRPFRLHGIIAFALAQTQPSYVGTIIITVNVMILNTSGCVSGKSTLIDRFVTGTFEITRDPTLEDSYMKKAVVDGEECVLNISDTSGIEEFSAMRKQYVLNGDGFLLVFSVNDRASFDYLIQKFLKLVEDKPVVCESHLLTY